MLMPQYIYDWCIFSTLIGFVINTSFIITDHHRWFSYNRLVFFYFDLGNGGGGIFNNSGDVFVTTSAGAGRIDNNVATTGSGGGILSVGGRVTIDGATAQGPIPIRGNSAAQDGGGIAIPLIEGIIEMRIWFRPSQEGSCTHH